MFCDYHVHTSYSDDSTYEMKDVVKDAIAMGMQEICFTDHVDYGIKLDWDQKEKMVMRDGKPLANVNYPLYFSEIADLKRKYGKRISIKQGMEFGIQTHTMAQYEKLFSAYDFDFIILSCHQVDNQEFWTQDFQRHKTQKEYNERYYQEIKDVIERYKHYSVLGHLDLITRYDQAGTYPFSALKAQLEAILKTVIADGKGIEVNTSSHRYGLKDLTPARDILRLYRDLGGKIITIGSDSHKKEHLGAYIEETKKELKAMGFAYFCTFEKMQPIYHEL